MPGALPICLFVQPVQSSSCRGFELVRCSERKVWWRVVVTLCAVVYTQEVTVTPCGGDGRNVALDIHKKMKDGHAGARLRESPLGLLSWQLTGQHPHPN